jgi:copper chaperone
MDRGRGYMSEVNLRIDGMHCGSCIRRVTQSLETIPGAEVAEVRLGAARVELPDIVGPFDSLMDSLIAVLGKAGFSAHVESDEK